MSKVKEVGAVVGNSRAVEFDVGKGEEGGLTKGEGKSMEVTKAGGKGGGEIAIDGILESEHREGKEPEIGRSVIESLGEGPCGYGDVVRKERSNPDTAMGRRAQEDLFRERDVGAVLTSEAKEKARDADKFVIKDANVAYGERSDAEGVGDLGAEGRAEDGKGRQGRKTSKNEMGGFSSDGDDEFREVLAEVKVEGDRETKILVGGVRGQKRDRVEIIKGDKVVF